MLQKSLGEQTPGMEKIYFFPCSEVSFYMTTEKQPFKKLRNCDFRIVMLVFGGSNYIKWFAVFLPTSSLCVWPHRLSGGKIDEKIFPWGPPLKLKRFLKLVLPSKMNESQNWTLKIAIDWYCLIPPKWVPFNFPSEKGTISKARLVFQPWFLKVVG